MSLFTAASSLLLLASLVSASPAPTARLLHAQRVEARAPEITASPSINEVTRTLKLRRDIFSDLKGDLNSIFSSLGSGIPSYVASGVPNFFQDFPTGDKVQSSLGIDDDQVRALPTQVLNIPPYANWTNQGWNVRIHGNVYKQPNATQQKLNELANLFLINTKIEDLPADQQAQARNVTASIFVLQQGNVNVSNISFEPAPNAGSNGNPSGGGGTQAAGGNQQVTLPYPTTDQGDFDVFVPIQSNGLQAGNSTTQIQKLNLYAQNTTMGNATAYLVPTTGMTIISDIDDILRITKIYQPSEGILNSFARPFTPWQNMPDIYAKWSKQVENLHFHYLTTTPEQITRNYMQYIYTTYPGGSFDTRPLNFSDVSATLSIRKFLLDKIFQTFPQRKFILVADTSNSDVMKDYPDMYNQYPGQVSCILLRNTTATDAGDRFPYDTSGFKGIPQDKYMFFVNAADIANLDIGRGGCYNQSVAQNLTFGYQGLPLGLGETAAVNGSANTTGAASAMDVSGAGWRAMLVSIAVVGGLFTFL